MDQVGATPPRIPAYTGSVLYRPPEYRCSQIRISSMRVRFLQILYQMLIKNPLPARFLRCFALTAADPGRRRNGIMMPLGPGSTKYNMNP